MITLKTVKGDHEKDIRIMKDNQISDDKSILLFNGNSYEKHNDTAGTMASLGTLASHLM